jgi:nucleoid-associated protein YgaU
MRSQPPGEKTADLLLSSSIGRWHGTCLYTDAAREKRNQKSIRGPRGGKVGIFGDLFSKKEKPRTGFSNVRSGGSSTAPTPGVPAPEPSATSMITGRTYVVVSGDSLSKIAKREYGDAQKWPKIYEANRNIIKDPDLIYPGQELRIPEA